MKTQQQEKDNKYALVDFSYIPPYHYKSDDAGRVRFYFGLLVEAAMSGFGKKVWYRSNDNTNPSFLGRGDTHHRVGRIISVQEHDSIIEASYLDYDKFQERINSKYLNTR